MRNWNKMCFINMEVEKKGFTVGIYTLLLGSLSCKMLFWTPIRLGGMALFFFPSHFYLPFSVWLIVLYFWKTPISNVFTFIYIRLWQFMQPDSLTPPRTLEEFVKLLFAPVGISWHSFLHLASSQSFYFFLEKQLFMSWYLLLTST